MKNSLLLPSRYAMIGWITFLVFSVLAYFILFHEFEIPGFMIRSNTDPDSSLTRHMGFYNNNLTNELAIFGTIAGLLMVCLARHKNEDEYISQLRLKAWQWAVLINYALLIIINLASYGLAYYAVVFFNSYTMLVIFIAKFYYSMYKINRQTEI